MGVGRANRFEEKRDGVKGYVTGGKRLGVVGVKMIKCWRRRRGERNRRSQKHLKKERGFKDM